MNNILNDFINNGYLDLYLSIKEKAKLKEVLENINTSVLYKSPFHGLYHSQKVLLNAYLLGLSLNLNEIDMDIIIDAAIYHDIGRINDNEDKMHGLISALRIDKIVDKNKYTEEDMNILKAIIDYHSQDDSKIDINALNYDIVDYNRYSKLASILKDADALDRTRFMKTSHIALQEKFLRLDYSKELISLAEQVNQYYRLKISEYYYGQYKNDALKANVSCKHGIGYDFFKLKSILQNGILSNYAKRVKKIDGIRQFNGNNNELWISVVNGFKEANKIFIENGISFDVLVPNLVEGETKKSLSYSNGMPIKSELYQDEKFVFYEIPTNDIIKINIPNLNENISNLDYLQGSLNVDLLQQTIENYLYNIRSLSSYFPDVTKVYTLLQQCRQEVLAFETKNNHEQQQERQSFFSKCDFFKEELNKEIQKWMSICFCKVLNKDNVTCFDVVSYICNELNITYEDDFILKRGKMK